MWLLVKVERIIITDYGEIFPITETFRVTKTKGYSSFIEQNDWIGSGDLASSFVTFFPLPRNIGAMGRDVPSICERMDTRRRCFPQRIGEKIVNPSSV